MIMNYTTKEQAKKLLELGLSPESSDMHWIYNIPQVGKTYGANIPCWSVGALLDVIPKYIYPFADEGKDVPYCVYVQKEQQYKVTLKENCGLDIIIIWYRDKLIDCLFDAVVYLLEKGYINVKK